MALPSNSYVVFSIPDESKEKQSYRESRYLLTGEDIVMGSSPHTTIHLPFKEIANEHVCVFYNQGNWHIEDISRGPYALRREGIFFRHHIVSEDGEVFNLGPVEFQIFLGNTRQSANHDEMYRRSMTDPLTQAHNRRSFEQHLSEAMHRLQHRSAWFSLVVFDIDFFKKFNTFYGHAGGDQVLKEVVQRVQRLVRKEEVVARIGGEEFAVILPDVGPEEAVEIGERIRSAVADEPFCLENGLQKAQVTLSAGVVSTDQYRETHLFLAQADQRLATAKQQGRNRVVDC